MIRRLWLFLSEHVDGVLLSFLCIAMLGGLIVLYSASAQDWGRVSSQFTNILVAMGVMWMVANVPPQHIMRFALPAYVIGLLLLVGVALFGEVSKGARRWLDIGVTRIQPSELMKVAVPLMLAWYLDKHEKMLRLRDFGVAALILVVPVALIAKQPDLGTALLMAASGFYVLFLAGIGWRVILGLGVVAGALLPVAWSVMHDYQRQRVMTLLDPSQDPLGAGYHIIQSTIALGSGGIFGKGYLNGTQAHLDFLPERHTDFIFAVLGEEFGMFGIGLLLLLYFAIIARGMYIAANAPSLFGRLMAGSITLTFATYAVVNMGMVSGILPVVGVPLPLVSYGGTAMVTLLLGFGIQDSGFRERCWRRSCSCLQAARRRPGRASNLPRPGWKRATSRPRWPRRAAAAITRTMAQAKIRRRTSSAFPMPSRRWSRCIAAPMMPTPCLARLMYRIPAAAPTKPKALPLGMARNSTASAPPSARPTICTA